MIWYPIWGHVRYKTCIHQVHDKCYKKVILTFFFNFADSDKIFWKEICTVLNSWWEHIFKHASVTQYSITSSAFVVVKLFEGKWDLCHLQCKQLTRTQIFKHTVTQCSITGSAFVVVWGEIRDLYHLQCLALPSKLQIYNISVLQYSWSYRCEELRYIMSIH